MMADTARSGAAGQSMRGPAVPHAFARFHSFAFVLVVAAVVASEARADCVYPPPAGNPKITAAKILTPSVNVQRAPGQPEFQVAFTAGRPGLGVITVSYAGPSPSNKDDASTEIVFNDAPRSGTVKLMEVFPGLGGGLNLYSAPGTWTVNTIFVEDNANNCTEYSGGALKAVLPTPTFTVVNTGTPDTQAPSILSATIATPTISRSASFPYLRVIADVSDDISGVISATFTFQTSGSSPSYLYASTSNAETPVKNGALATGAAISPSTPVGTYRITSVEICNVNFTCTVVDKKHAMDKLFGGASKASFAITD
jgi:hypothetical protein